MKMKENIKTQIIVEKNIYSPIKTSLFIIFKQKKSYFSWNIIKKREICFA